MRLHLRPARILSALMLVAVVNVYVFANGAIVSSNKSAGASGSTKVLFGKLVTTSNRPVIVNGAEAITGTIILSGAQLATSVTSMATVRLENLGTVTIAPDSSVSLSFDAKSVTVKVGSGDASVSTVEGVTGTVIPATASTAPAGGNSAKNWGIAGVAVGGGAFIWAIIAWNKANNAEDDAKAAQASAATLASQLAALRTCLAGQTASPVKLCTSF
jgi:hypothetical protein